MGKSMMILLSFSLPVLIQPPSVNVLSAFLHTSCTLETRIKHRHTHKPFWRIKKTAKHPDEPLTLHNRMFLEEMKQQSFVNTRVPAEILLNGEAEKSPLKNDLVPWASGEWSERGTKRTALIGRKIGVQKLWYKTGKSTMATLIQIEDNHVIKYISKEDYAKTVYGEKLHRPAITARIANMDRGCLIVGALSADPAKFTKDYCGLFTETGLMPKKKLARFPVSDNAILQPGTKLFASHFMPGQYVDVRGRTVRRGFQGVMKRWGFHGMPHDTHGTTKSHRRPGCIGSGRAKHRVWPGQKMPGHMGGDFRRICGLRILRINYEENILYIQGSGIPGEHGEFVYIQDTVIPNKKLKEKPRFFPTASYEANTDLPEEEYCETVHKFTDPSIVFQPEVVKKKK